MNAYCNITINLTDKCNTICRYCFRESSPKSKEFLSTEIVKKVLDWCKTRADGKQFVQLTGGEVFLHPEIWNIIQYAKSLEYVVRIQTNGLLFSEMTDKQLSYLAQPGIVTKISLDGWNEDTHELYRAKNTFNRTVKGLVRFGQNHPRFCVKSVLSPLVAANFQKMLDLSLQLDAAGISYNFLRKEGRAADLTTDLDEFGFVKMAVGLFNEERYRHLLNGSQILDYWMHPRIFKRNKHFFINYNGDVYANQKMIYSEFVGNVNKDISCLNDAMLVDELVVRPLDIWTFIKKNLKIDHVRPP